MVITAQIAHQKKVRIQKMNNGGIYKILNTTNNKLYIGSAVKVRRRIKEHKTALRRGNHHCKHLQNAWLKYGEEAFLFLVIEQVELPDLTIREQFYLNKYRREELYNTCLVAHSNLGMRYSEEVKSRMRESAKNRKRPPPFTDEHRKNLGLSGKGRRRSPESIAKGKESMKHVIITLEWRRKIADSRRGKPGVKHTDDAKARISASHMGMRPSEGARKKLSEETRAKMSASRRNYLAIKKSSIGNGGK